LTFEDLAVTEFSGHTRAMLKIQEGCQNFCSYCIIPYARGPERSRPMASVLDEAQRLAVAGYKEVVLTGIHLSSYGRDLEGHVDLADLMADLVTIDGLERIRLSSTEPTDVTDKLIALMAGEPRVCPHLHIPLQSGDDEVLRRMNRRYRTNDYRRLVERLRASVPDIAITTDIIVGFPGETEQQFDNIYRFVEEMAFSRLHIFRYSARQGTPAAKYADQVPKAVQEERSHVLKELGDRMAEKFHRAFIGRELSVLFEQRSEDGKSWVGYSGNYVRVRHL
jgi:threonylcarbamoyladenosine tRNA methylthiotransferase MtaB